MQKDSKIEHTLQKNTSILKFNLSQGIKKKLKVLVLIIISPQVNSNTVPQEKATQGICPQSWGQTRPGLLEIAALNPQYLPQNLEMKTDFCSGAVVTIYLHTQLMLQISSNTGIMP